MYKSASQYLSKNVSHLMEPYKHIEIKPTQLPSTNTCHTNPVYTSPTNPIYSPPCPTPPSHPKLHWEKEQVTSLLNPQVWGPPFWFSLHVSAANYPVNPSPIWRERMKGRILAIPFEIPCAACKPHAAAFIENNKHRLDDIVSSRKSLIRFYVDFHNKVNERYGKRQWTYEEAEEYYSKGGTVERLKY